MEVPEAAQLRAWYDSVGRDATHVAAGEGLATARCGARALGWDMGREGMCLSCGRRLLPILA